MFWFVLFVLLQMVVLVVGLYLLSTKFLYVQFILMLLSILIVLWVINSPDNPSYKLAWAVPIALFPLVGGFFYLIFGNNRTPRDVREGMTRALEDALPYIPSGDAGLEALRDLDKQAYCQAHYLDAQAYAPTFMHTYTDFQTPGEQHFPVLLEELRRAERYIFMEYFIVRHGVMLDSILDMLEERARAGVDVRILYDDMGSLQTVPRGFVDELAARGIKVLRFYPVSPRLDAFLNNRDHRKITVIDGLVAFTGGVNLADEYINQFERFGYWKDSALMLKGDAAWRYAVMFLQTWALFSKEEHVDYASFLPDPARLLEVCAQDGFVAPYGDDPVSSERISASVYRNVIAAAQDYLYIETPYFIPDNEILSAIELAAKKGVDVRIVVPHIPDKKSVFLVTQAHYSRLIAAGVRVYEYTPGFIHTKGVVADDLYAVAGTVNFDYRSLYLHFECGAWMYRTRAVTQMRDDFLALLEDCQEITAADTASYSIPKRFLQANLCLFAPLL